MAFGHCHDGHWFGKGGVTVVKVTGYSTIQVVGYQLDYPHLFFFTQAKGFGHQINLSSHPGEVVGSFRSMLDIRRCDSVLQLH